MMYPFVPHFDFPFRLGGDGGFAAVEQDSDDDVINCIQVLLATPVGSRLELPEYGVGDQTFRTRVDMSDILTAVADWEPRANISVSDDIDTVDELIRYIRVDMTSGGATE